MIAQLLVMLYSILFLNLIIITITITTAGRLSWYSVGLVGPSGRELHRERGDSYPSRRLAHAAVREHPGRDDGEETMGAGGGDAEAAR